MSVGEFCNREVVIARREVSILELAQLMRQHYVGDIVIMDSSSGSQKKIAEYSSLVSMATFKRHLDDEYQALLFLLPERYD